VTGADTVIFLENDYNPFADLQAMDRAHRIGQKRSVNVFHLVAKASIEERIMELQEKKVAMSNAIVNTDNSKMYSMGTDRLLDIFTFRSDQEKRSTEESQQSRHNLDAIVERYSEDYASLTVEEFVRNLLHPPDGENKA
jgi:TATA-binding protein-associated factor